MLLPLLALLLLPQETAQLACGGHGSTWSPGISKVVLASNQSQRIPYMNAASMDQSYIDACLRGISTTMRYIGKLDVSMVYFLAPGGTDADYAPLIADYKSRGGDDQVTWLADKAKTSQHPGGNYLTTMSCCGNDMAYQGVMLAYTPGTPHDTASGSLYANPLYLYPTAGVHEYTHAVQAMYGPMGPPWLTEGGAVHLECLLGDVLGTYPQGSGSSNFTNCVSMFLSNAKNLYAQRGAGLTLKHCEASPFPPGSVAQSSDTRFLCYEAGMVAIMYAIMMAGGTPDDFWRSDTKGAGRGFWRTIEPTPGGWVAAADVWTDANSNGWTPTAEAGWRRAWLAYTGKTSMDEFYSEFDAWMLDGTGATVAALTATGSLGTTFVDYEPPADRSQWPWVSKSVTCRGGATTTSGQTTQLNGGAGQSGGRATISWLVLWWVSVATAVGSRASNS